MSRRARHPARALVTGGSSGIGRAVAERLAAGGTRVFTASRSPSLPVGPAADHLVFDARLPGASAALVERLEAAGAFPELVVHAAGAAVFCEAIACEGSAWRSHFAAHVDAAHELAAAVLPRFRAEGGTLVLVGSLASEVPIPGLAAYCAAKAALATLAQALILEEPEGSRAVVIEFRPGDVRTGFNTRMERESPPRSRDVDVRVWARLEEHLRSGETTAAAAQALLRAVARGRSGVARFGLCSQLWGARIARMLPSRLRWAALRRYHGLRA